MPESQPVNLNITDIADAVKIIDYAFEQGGFKGLNNIRQIVQVRDRLDAFITAASLSNEAKTPDISSPDLNSEASVLEKAEAPRKRPIRRHSA